MPHPFSLVQNLHPVEAITPITGGSARTGDYISLKNYHKVFVVVHIQQATSATAAITIEQATAVAGTGTTAITNTVPIWANEACATDDTLVRQTDAVAFTTSAATTNKLVIFEIVPESLNVAGGFDCLTVKVGASHSTSILAAQYYGVPRNQSRTATAPSVVVD